jgi:hypothetical protein
VSLALIKWLGEVWRARILEQDRQRNSIEIERLRRDLQRDIQLLLKRQEQSFNLSITSHMANVAFDKHIAFCEEYAQCAIQCVDKLFKVDSADNTLLTFGELAQIRQKYAPWVPSNVIQNLLPFEGALFQVNSKYVLLQNNASFSDKAAVSKEMLSTFSQIIGMPSADENGNSEIAIQYILTYLQNILGISEITQLRSIFVKRAIQDSENV